MFGLYILANDDALKWLEPFLSSLRMHNRRVPVTVIPYDENCAKALRLAARYGCDSLQMDLAPYDKIGARFHPDEPIALHIYRKLAIFDGPYSRFLYLDIDTVVAINLDEIDRMMSCTYHDICFYRTAMPDRNFADPALSDLAEARYPAHGNRGFNAAFIMGRRGTFSLSQLSSLASQPERLATRLGPAREQAFLNYCVLTSGLRATTLPHINPAFSYSWDSFLDIRFDAETGLYRTDENCPDYPGANEVIYGREGAIAGKVVPMIHWGGYAQPSRLMDNFEIWNRFARWPSDVRSRVEAFSHNTRRYHSGSRPRPISASAGTG
jgi:hypothetical protein